MLIAIYGLSAVVVAPLFNHLAADLNWIDSLRIVVASLTLIGWIGVFILPKYATPERTAKASVKFFTVLKNRELLVSAAILVLTAPLCSMIFAEIGNLIGHLSASPAWISLSVVLMSIGNSTGRFFGGALADRSGGLAARNLVLGLNVLSGIGILMLSGSLIGLVLLAFMFGLGFGGLAGILSPLAKKVVPQAPHTAFGFLFGGFAFGSFIGPLLGSWFGSGTGEIMLLTMMGILIAFL
ncbi:hypothetical protein [Paenibacillus caui]|uniref:hypothetical protein n=1 Tax=Paenibacillus caui TaxID=2873927 RepID=UPI001CA8381F|nr:hypothetical protein [Paenibacillus caui]